MRRWLYPSFLALPGAWLVALYLVPLAIVVAISFGTVDEMRERNQVLDEHCAAIGRDPDEIERSTLQTVDLAKEAPNEVVTRFGELADAGAEHVIFSLRGLSEVDVLERIGRDVLPQVRDL